MQIRVISSVHVYADKELCFWKVLQVLATLTQAPLPSPVALLPCVCGQLL